MLGAANIVTMASIDWAFNWQTVQEVALALSEGGNRVLFVENTGVRRPSLRDVPRLRARLANWRGGIRRVRDGLDVFPPLLLPLPYSPLATGINSRLLLRVVRRWLRGGQGRPVIVLTFLPTPLVRSLVRGLRPALVVYYCSDRLAESSPGAARLRPCEEEFFGETDLVLATSTGLRAMAAPWAPRVELLGSGVRSAEFARAREGLAGATPPWDGVSGPVVGFAGSVRNELDLELLAAAAELAPELTFVLLGPELADVRRLSARRNVRLLGPVSHAEVVRAMPHFQVGMLPYVLNAYTADIMPTKLKEYLAAGLPIVATPLPEVCRFAAEHPETVAIAPDAPGFVAALRAAVAAGNGEAVLRRMEIARRYDWSVQMAQMRGWMEALLASHP
jgi:glycosyltransferase involved in cell wall biosynthesis